MCTLPRQLQAVQGRLTCRPPHRRRDASREGGAVYGTAALVAALRDGRCGRGCLLKAQRNFVVASPQDRPMTNSWPWGRWHKRPGEGGGRGVMDGDGRTGRIRLVIASSL